MGKKGGSPLPAPDPVATANAQAQANKEAIYASAQVNSPNLYGPSGSVTYTRDGNGVPTAQYVKLTPQGQATFTNQQTIAGNLTNQALQRVNALPTDPFTLQGAPYDPSSYNVGATFPTFNPVRTGVPGGNGYGYPQPMQQQPSSYYGYGMPAAPQPQYGSFGSFSGGGSTSPTSFATSQAQSFTGGAGMPSQTPVTPAVPAAPSTPYVPATPGKPAVAAQPARDQWYNDQGKPVDVTPDVVSSWSSGPFAAGPPPGWTKQHIDAVPGQAAVPGKPAQGTPPGAMPAAPAAVPTQTQQQQPTSAAPQQQTQQQLGFGGGNGSPFDVVSYLQQNPQAAQQFNTFANTGQLPPGFSIPGMSAAGTVPNSGIPNGNNAVVPYDPASYGNLNMYNDAAGNAVFNNQATMLAPQFKQENEQLLQNLADRGIPVGSDAYNKAMDQLSRQHTQQWQSVANTATAASTGAAQQKMAMEQALNSAAFGQALQTHNTQSGDYLNQINLEQQLRNTAIQNALLARTQNLNEASAYLQGAPALQQPQAPQMPNYNIAPAPIADSTYRSFDAAMQGYNAQMQNSQSMWQGITGLVGTGAKLAFGSARELKHDDGPPIGVLDALDNIEVRTWRYKPEIDPKQTLHIGPYAEDWHAQTGFGDGKTINAIDAIGICLQAIKELQAEVKTLKEAA